MFLRRCGGGQGESACEVYVSIYIYIHGVHEQHVDLFPPACVASYCIFSSQQHVHCFFFTTMRNMYIET